MVADDPNEVVLDVIIVVLRSETPAAGLACADVVSANRRIENKPAAEQPGARADFGVLAQAERSRTHVVAKATQARQHAGTERHVAADHVVHLDDPAWVGGEVPGRATIG